ncbi:GDP-mannose 4,6 dehydratase 1-like [Rhodamnia argentea]|uniref:GDP-mannose 4,6-dehydratase n=1 Tax=Rhodamnia argentea TaxID=178133 RepID=A0ABM3GXG8_9MYRT|nr:GDP-mannose 4,6 dehydratase 1-like [Rhodamnia argentea]
MAIQSDTPKSGSGANGEALPPQHSKVALITGITSQVTTSQDGWYLTKLLLDKGYEVHDLICHSPNFETRQVDNIYIDRQEHENRIKLHFADPTDASSLRLCIDTISPDEVYNLAGQSDMAASFEIPDYTADMVATVTLRLLEAVRCHVSATGRSHIRYCQAGSSEIFGPQEYEYWPWNPQTPLSETSPFHPQSPYAVSKWAAHRYAVHYREAHGLFVCNGILFNHESPRRGENFLSRKITRAVGRIKMGLQSKLFLGDLHGSQEWGFAGDYVEAMWIMLQQEKPDDYVVAMEKSHRVVDFLALAFDHAGLYFWDHVVIDERYLRLGEVDNLKGDASKAKKVLGWEAEVGFDELVKMMVDEDLELAKRDKFLVHAQHKRRVFLTCYLLLLCFLTCALVWFFLRISAGRK